MRLWRWHQFGHTLWNDVLRYNVDDPGWLNRDRFVLSAGHASMLIYSLLHLAQVKRWAREGGEGETQRRPCRSMTSSGSASLAASAPVTQNTD